MPPIEDPDCISPDDCLSELASIFAVAILRLHTRAALETAPAESESTCLDVPSETVLSDHHG